MPHGKQSGTDERGSSEVLNPPRRPISSFGRLRFSWASATCLALLYSPSLAAQTMTMEQLQALVAAQQQMLQNQQRVLESLQAQITAMKQAPAPAAATAAPGTGATGSGTVAAGSAPAGAAPAPTGMPARTTERQEVSNMEPRVQLMISGQANRAVNLASDGHATKGYFVDNQNSTSRVRFMGIGRLTDDLTLGSRIEIGIRPNSSNIVSQNNEDAGDSFDQRIVEAYAESKKWGKLTLGKGPTAADGAHEVDLSGTDVAAYSAISDIAGGLQFRSGGATLSGVTIGEGFTNYDGSRRDRLRYDTPTFAGFTLAGAAISDQRWDSALFWTGKNEFIKAMAAVAVQDPNIFGIDLRYGGSFSVLHDGTGLNFTGAVGSDSRDNKDSYNFYGKLGLMRNFFDFGYTAFSIDYTYSKDVAVSSPSLRADGHSVGGYVVQKIADFGVDLYAGLRWFTLDADGSLNLDDIFVTTVGSRVKF